MEVDEEFNSICHFRYTRTRKITLFRCVIENEGERERERERESRIITLGIREI